MPPQLKIFTNEKKFHSQSVGKSFASYILGHAICKGYVDGIDSKLNDWPILENTLYHNQKIIDIINMKAGDEKYFSPKDKSNIFANSDSKYSVTNRTIKSVMESELKNSKKSIPLGTLSAIGVGLVIYLGLAIFIAFNLRNQSVKEASQCLNYPQLV